MPVSSARTSAQRTRSSEMKMWRDLLVDLISRSPIARWARVPLRAFTAIGLGYAIGVSGIHSAAHQALQFRVPSQTNRYARSKSRSARAHGRCAHHRGEQVDKNRPEDHPSHRSWHTRRRLPHLHRPERRPRWLRLMERELLAQRVVGYQVASMSL